MASAEPAAAREMSPRFENDAPIYDTFSTCSGYLLPEMCITCIEARARGWHSLSVMDRDSCAEGNQRRARSVAVALVCVATGCGDGGGPREGAICPDCRRSDVAGSETSDFSGSIDECTGVPAPLPDGAALDSVLELMAAYAGRFESTLRWRYPAFGPPDPPFGPTLDTPEIVESAPSGYEESTQVSGNVVLGEMEFFAGLPASSEVTVECPDWFRVPASVEIATADAALAVTLRGEFQTSPRRSRSLRARADLASAVGNLSLQFPSGVPHAGSFDLELAVYPEGKRGRLMLELTSGETLDHLMTATFPDDACGVTGFPAAADEPLASLDGQSAQEFLGEWRSALESATPVRGLRGDCASGERRNIGVSFVVGALQHVCQGAPLHDASPVITFDSTSRLDTSDGSVNAPLPVGVATRTRLRMTTGDSMERIAAGEFAERTGILDVDPSGSPWLSHYVIAEFLRAEGITVPSGFLLVEGGDGAAYTFHASLTWPDTGVTVCP